MPADDTRAPDNSPRNAFIARWSHVGAAERANYALFLTELCDHLGVPRPDPATDHTSHNAYVFERAVTFHHRGSTKTTTGRIDLYKRGCFVLEAKQYTTPKTETTELSLDGTEHAPKTAKIARGTAAWDRAMLEALGQAERYARSLPADEDPPPFLVVVDVGHVIELYADFTQKGKNYLPFPDSRSHRIKLADLAQPDISERLRLVWSDPIALDPSKKAAAVTREVAGYLAELAKSFEKHHDPKLVAEFLSRCLFCMFAEDVGLLPKNGFKEFLDSIKRDPGSFVPLAEQLFADMNEGRVSGLLRRKLLYFNGGLFAEARALPVNGTQLGLLRAAASLEWRHVEPAIFGTLLERALSPAERHKLGAHYTPRAYVERLVLPTLIEPLREEWSGIRIAAVTLAQRGTDADIREARSTVRAFHDALCKIRVLDPACGSGNFLYVALEQMKRLEGEVITLLRDLGETDVLALQGVTVDPHQFLGIEINPRAAAIAELVLWIGYLQWHFRVHGDALPAEPVLRKFNNIENRDAVLAHDGEDFAKDEHGQIRYVWDRRTYKTHPVTGRKTPDDQAVIPLRIYTNPRQAEWPHADYIIGNPPFIGKSKMRDDLGDGYTETLRATYPNVPESADFVMYWWHKAAEETLSSRTRRFGFITTNSIRQTFNRRVVKRALMEGISLRFAIPDHPWVDTAEGAAVRIAMTVGVLGNTGIIAGRVEEPPDPGAFPGELLLITGEQQQPDGSALVTFAALHGRIGSGLNIGAELEDTVPLKANDGLASTGLILGSRGFVITRAEADTLKSKDPQASDLILPLRNGEDLTSQNRDAFVIDTHGWDEDSLREKIPHVYAHLHTTVKPDRETNRDPKLRKFWWLFRRSNEQVRGAIAALQRYIVTVETTKHRLFQFLDAAIKPEHVLIVVGLDNAFHLGVLSSHIHVVYALAAGGTLEDRPRYNKSRCFDPFPFPDCTEKQKERIRALAEELDAHRKRAQQQHGLGLTDIYNVLQKLRAHENRSRSRNRSRSLDPNASVSPENDNNKENENDRTLTPKERAIHDAALVSTLKQLHDDLDATVADAYGWPWPLSDAEILERVVALNTARAAEEAQGKVRWLRPDYQIPLLAPSAQTSLGLDNATNSKSGASKKRRIPQPPATGSISRKKAAWPKTLSDRVRSIELALASEEKPVTAADLAKRFSRANPGQVDEILHTLVTLGRAHEADTEGTFVQ